MGARTDAARAEVLAARASVSGELERLEAAGRSAVDIPAKVKRAPAKTAAAAGGAAFLLAGGPKRVFRRVRRAVRGPEADLPKSMLPKEVDQALRKLGSDGDKVRGTIEKEFAKYLEEHAEERKSRDLGAVAAGLATSALAPVTKRLGRQLAEQLLSPERGSFEEALERIRRRNVAPPASGGGTSAGRTTTPPKEPPPRR